ncbi:MAG: hypothetical protein GY847_33010 [Proteobacteria bacterium]|nr:hypothetical protein [Pseudomonadota bacterium]
MSFYFIIKKHIHLYLSIASLGLVLPYICGCIDGGLNQNQHTPGNEEDGVSLSLGEIAIDPTGSYFLSSSGDSLIHGDIDRAEVEILPGIENPDRLAFGGDNQIFVTSCRILTNCKLIAYNTGTHKIEWTRKFIVDRWGVHYPLLAVSEDRQKVIFTGPYRLRVLSAADGQTLHNIAFNEEVIDVDLHPDEDRIIVTLDDTWKDGNPETQIIVYSMATQNKIKIQIPNCSDELVLAPEGNIGFLAPTNCAQDPVSVIDFNNSEFIRNLPGFGPVAIAPSGDTVVAFMDMDNLDVTLFDSQKDIPKNTGEQYRLMFIDIDTLKFDSIELGDDLPRYAITPNGQMLLIDASTWFDDARIRMLDIATRKLRPVAGPDVRLHNFVITSDSEKVLLIDDGLYDLSIPEYVVESVALIFTPKNINITPDDTRLLLRENDSLLWVYDIASRRTIHSISTIEIDTEY